MRLVVVPCSLILTSLLVAGCDATGQEPQPPAVPQQQQNRTPTTVPTSTTQPVVRQAPGEPPEQLFGTWVADNVKTKLGQMRIKLALDRSGHAHIVAWSKLPLVGQVRNERGPVEVTDHTLHSDAIHKGATVQYALTSRGQLVIEYKDGKTVTFVKADESARR